MSKFLVPFTAALYIYCTLVLPSAAYSQAPDPAQTVNTATGEMSLSIPLGEIAGIGGLGYSANLNYKAGIRTTDEASPAGLGFSYEPGGISRKVVYVPDDNIGGDGSYYEGEPLDECDHEWWKWLICIGLIVIAIVVTIIGAVCGGGAAGSMLLTAGISGLSGSLGTMYTMTQIEFNAKDFLAGGTHDNQYSHFLREDGLGFMRGATGDLPDIYFINTPYMNGRIRPAGAADNAGNVIFTLAVSDGSPGSRAKIVYNINTLEFTITMEDGKRLILGGTEAVRRNSTSTTKVFTSQGDNGTDCFKDVIFEQRENVPSEWLLRNVFGADYYDGDNDHNPLTNPNQDQGSWVAFCYSRTTTPNARRLPMTIQGGPNTTIVNYPGYEGHFTFDDVYLDSIRTALGKVEYKYKDGRLDDVWFNAADFDWHWNEPDKYHPDDAKDPPATQINAFTNNVQPINRKVLDTVLFYNANNTKIRSVAIKTIYKLRPNSFYSMRKNTNGVFERISTLNMDMACLTLNAIEAYDNAMGNMTITNFSYAYNPSSWHPWSFKEPGIPRPLCFYREPRDGWGYYKPAGTNSSDPNDFNFSGESSKAIHTGTGIAYCAAWSMTSMALPSGMRLTWEYESNRFDSCNNIFVTSTGGEPRYGGGPRVKKVTLDPTAPSQPTTLSYFYTSDNSFVESNTNSSGHATVQPFPYLEISGEEGNDPRDEKTRGSFYTPTKVAYQRVKIVKNYIPPVNPGEDGLAPSGYTENLYFTSANFPNPGKYGQFDESWRRGFIGSATQYNASKKVINKSVNHYDWIRDATSWNTLGYLFSGGTVRLKYQTNTSNKVQSRSDNFYADEIENPGADRLAARNCSFYNYTVLQLLQIPLNPEVKGFSATGSFIGNTDYKDMITLIHQHTNVDGWTNRLDIAFTWDCDMPNASTPIKSTYNMNLVSAPSFMGLDIEDLNIYVRTVTATIKDVYVVFTWYLGEKKYFKIPNVQVSGNTLTHGSIITTVPPPADAVRQTTNLSGVGSIKYGNFVEIIIPYVNRLYTADRDGRPNRTTTTNSDGDTLIKEIVPAFTQTAYYDMVANNNNILAPISQTTTFGKKKATGTPTEPYVVSAQATKWSKTAGIPAWMPCSTFAWKADFQDDGTPDRTFANFDHTPDATNPNWQYTGSVTRYNPNSQPLETGKPTPTGNQSLSAMVYGHGNVLPIGSITNANFLECGVFTCDYDQNELYNGNYYFDKANGWEKCGSVLSTTKKHFGEKSVYVNLPAGTTAFGPSRNVALSYNTDYVFSAWVLVVSGELVINGNYRGRTNSENPILLNEMNRSFSVPAKRVPAATQWQYVELKIPASTDLPFNIWRLNNGLWAARVYIGEPNGVEAFIDDIRFAPKKSFVTTTYYDQLWRQPVISVDANNKPGKKVTFDGFGRPIQWDKIDPSKSVGDAGYATTLQRKAYHIRNELLEGENIQVFLPNGGETFTAEHIMNIHWSSRVAGDVTILYQNADGSDPHNITLSPIINQQGYGTYEWTIPDDVVGANKVIKVSSTAAGGCNDASDAPFTIVQNKYGPLTYLSPSNGANVGPGSNVTLSWKGSGYTTGVISYRVWFRDNMLNEYTWDTDNVTQVVSSGYGESRWNITPIKDGIVGPTGPTWIFIKSIGM